MPKQPTNKLSAQSGLVITKNTAGVLSSAQIAFNKVMKKLEDERVKHQRKQKQLDDLMAVVIRDIMPLLEDLNRANRDLVFHVAEAMHGIKLSKKRINSLKDLVEELVNELLSDPCGISEEDVSELQKILEQLHPPEDQALLDAEAAEGFDFMRSLLESVAKKSGLDLDLSDLDPNMNPADLERQMEERFRAAAAANHSRKQSRPRKQTTAQKEKAAMQAEIEEAKKRDLKSLYKQLAKALHPDLETDASLKDHKEVWMKRLTSAYAEGNLRELLQIEMEWLGEEAGNLASAGDEKLKVYCAVLKEQIADMKLRTNSLIREPQYGPLRRFVHPFIPELPKPAGIMFDLKNDLQRQTKILKGLKAENSNPKKIIEFVADNYWQYMNERSIPF
ncbi:MAG: hypothetical protein ACK6AY_05830 [Akkermansiaceae bacterium]